MAQFSIPNSHPNPRLRLIPPSGGRPRSVAQFLWSLFRWRHELGAHRIAYGLGDDGIHLRQSLAVELPADHVLKRRKLAGVTRSPKRHRHSGLIQQPTDGEREYPFAVAVSREPCEKTDSLSVLSEAWRQELRVRLSEVVPFEFGNVVDFTCQKATAQRAVRQGRDAVFATPGNDVVQGL